MGDHGTNHTLPAVSSRFWIFYARESVKKWQGTCGTCKKEKAKPALQLMDPLRDTQCKLLQYKAVVNGNKNVIWAYLPAQRVALCI